MARGDMRWMPNGAEPRRRSGGRGGSNGSDGVPQRATAGRRRGRGGRQHCGGGQDPVRKAQAGRK